MAVKMRLRREGKRKQPYYRVVVADGRSPRDGRFIEDIGYYQPLREPSEISIDRDRALYWLGEGVQPSDAVRQLLRVTGIWEEFRPGDTGRRRSRQTAAATQAGGDDTAAAANADE
jgi:small subunit ribosomal protein S16